LNRINGTDHQLILNDSAHQLQAEAGEIILLRGEVGCGKTVWLKRMAGLMKKPDAISMTQPAVVRMLFDRWPALWIGGTVEEELVFGLGQALSKQQLYDALSAWGLSDVSLGCEIQSLNRLQSLRLSLAAIALAKPDLVLLDNPSAALEPESAMQLSEDIAGWIKASNTIVVVASNRWQDWDTVATQTWMVSVSDQLPEKL